MTHFIVQDASTSRVGKFGEYRKVAVLEVDLGLSRVSMISERARGCHRVVQVWDKLHVGKTAADAYSHGLASAQALADRLNKKRKAPRKKRTRSDTPHLDSHIVFVDVPPAVERALRRRLKGEP